MISRRNTALALASIALAAMFLQQMPRSPAVKLATSMGDIVVQLDPAKAPKTVENFLPTWPDKHYDGTIFHRVIDGFMIQGGGFTADMVQKPRARPSRWKPQRPEERHLHHRHGAHQPHSATAQFFINVKDNAMLNAPSPTATAMPCSARWSRAWRWSTRSRPCHRQQGPAPERAHHPRRHHLGHLVK
jgi:peptidyl-prolyl cis-trans isomerase A (cyclophilin A)